MDPRPLLCHAELAKALRISYRSLARMMKVTPNIPFRQIGRRRFFYLDEVLDALVRTSASMNGYDASTQAEAVALLRAVTGHVVEHGE